MSRTIGKTGSGPPLMRAFSEPPATSTTATTGTTAMISSASCRGMRSIRRMGLAVRHAGSGRDSVGWAKCWLYLWLGYGEVSPVTLSGASEQHDPNVSEALVLA